LKLKFGVTSDIPQKHAKYQFQILYILSYTKMTKARGLETGVEAAAAAPGILLHSR
jgi:hypothetical protein